MNEKLRLARIKKHLSEREVCKAIGADMRTYQHWEYGRHIPQPYYRERLCALFEMSLEELGYDPLTLLLSRVGSASALPPVHRAADVREDPDAQALEQTDQLLSLHILTREQAASLHQIMRGENINMNELRRKLLQLGIAGATLVMVPPVDVVESSPLRLEADHVALLENEMSSRWRLYYTGGATGASIGFERWLQEVVRTAQLSKGTALSERAHTVLCMSYQLQGCILRDVMQFPDAHKAFRRAFLIAQELYHPELMAAVLAREGVTLTQQGQVVEAANYLTQAHELVKHLGFVTLEGYILQGLSEAQAINQSQSAWQSLEYAENLLAQKSQEAETSFTRFNTASVRAQRGVNAAHLHDYVGCIASIDVSLKSYDATLIRGRARLLVQKAEAYWELAEIDACAQSVREAYLLAHSAGAGKTVARAKSLAANLIQSHGKERQITELSEVLSVSHN